MTEKQLAANRRNASMAGRPAGSMNAEKIAFRDWFRAKEVELADNLITLALHGKTEQIRLAATASELISKRVSQVGKGPTPRPRIIGPITLASKASELI